MNSSVDCSGSVTNSVEKFRILLSKISSFGEIKDSNQLNGVAIGKELSQLLLARNGVFHFLVACDDLGGESFWKNTTALSAVAKLLITKPSSVKSVERYHSYIIKNLLIVFKNPTWNSRVALMFSLTLDLFYKVSPLCLRSQVIDKMVRPFELLLERGELYGSNSENGLWNRHLDGATWLMARWVDAMPVSGTFPFYKQILKILPILMHLVGQALSVTKLNADNGDITFSTFIKDVVLICQRLLNTFSDKSLQIKYLLDNVLLKNLKHQEGVDFKCSYFEMTKSYAMPASFTTSKSIVLDDNVPKDEKLHYPGLHLFLRDEAFSLQDFVDFKLCALEAFPNTDNHQERGRFLMELLSAVFEICKTANPLCSPMIADDLDAISTFRFGPAVEDVVESRLLRTENSVFLPHYVLTTVVQWLSNFDFSRVEDEDENHLLRFVEIVESIQHCYKDDFNASKPHDLMKMKISASSSCDELKRLLIDVDDYPAASAQYNYEVDTALCGHALIEIAKRLRERNTRIFSCDDDFERVYTKLIAKLESTDSYIFLAAINAVAELAYWKTDPYLDRLIELFLKWDKIRLSKPNGSDAHYDSDDDISEPDVGDADPTPEQRSLVSRGKIGESLAKVLRQLGDFSPLYFDRLCDALLPMARNHDEIIRCSALSALADLVMACRGRYYDKAIQEFLSCVEQIVSSEKSPLVRRAAVHLLRSLIASAGAQKHCALFEIFSISLAKLTADLKRLWNCDEDDVVRLHSELALIELEESMKKFFINE